MGPETGVIDIGQNSVKCTRLNPLGCWVWFQKWWCAMMVFDYSLLWCSCYPSVPVTLFLCSFRPFHGCKSPFGSNWPTSCIWPSELSETCSREGSYLTVTLSRRHWRVQGTREAKSGDQMKLNPQQEAWTKYDTTLILRLNISPTFMLYI